MTFNVEETAKILGEYPKLKDVILVGTLSLKLTREVIGLERLEMYQVHKSLVRCGATVPVGTNSFRATQDLRDYLRKENKHDN